VDTSEFCSLHNNALNNLEEAYSHWNKAFDGLSKDEYYSRVEHLPETGEAVKQVIRYLRKESAVR
jgi:hypothetical protein